MEERNSHQRDYIRDNLCLQCFWNGKSPDENRDFVISDMARSARLERATHGLEGLKFEFYYFDEQKSQKCGKMKKADSEVRAYIRTRIVYYKERDYEVKVIGELLNVPDDYVYHILEQYRENGNNIPEEKVRGRKLGEGRTLCSIAKRFVEGGLEQENRYHKITGEVEAHMMTIACSELPQGRSQWTLQMIADRLVELKVMESISATAVGTTLKK